MALCAARWSALGTGVAVFVEDRAQLHPARRLVEDELAALDLAASRFRADSELTRINRSQGGWIEVSPLCFAAIEAGVRAARVTDGAVDLTIGRSLRVAGYDRDHRSLQALGPRRITFVAAAGWRTVELNPARRAVRVPAGVELDLGATAKALGADRAAARVAGELGAGAMVSFGGDVAVAGTPPAGGWPVRVTDHHASGFQAPGQTISIATGGLATSSTTARRWAGPDHELHHILDPRTGRPVPGTWRTVSVAAATCLDANVASTAAVIQGVAAPGWLERLGLPARLAGSGDRVVYVGNWPRDEAAA